MSEGARVVFMLCCCMGWAGFCGILSHVFDQPRAADAIATFLGVLMIVCLLR